MFICARDLVPAFAGMTGTPFSRQGQFRSKWRFIVKLHVIRRIFTKEVPSGPYTHGRGPSGLQKIVVAMTHFPRWMSSPLAFWFVILGALADGAPLSPDDRIPRFENQILPLFQGKCLICHGETLKQRGLDLRTRDGLLKGGESGAALAPGDSGGGCV